MVMCHVKGISHEHVYKAAMVDSLKIPYIFVNEEKWGSKNVALTYPRSTQQATLLPSGHSRLKTMQGGA